MELSCKSEYAILALLEMATHYENGEPMQIRQIALQQKIPDRYLEQLLATLRRGGIVKSQRGSKGGYLLAREPRKISVFDILECLEGLDVQTGEQNTNPTSLDNSVVSEIWQEARQAANSVLQNYSLQDLCEKRDSRTAVGYHVLHLRTEQFIMRIVENITELVGRTPLVKLNRIPQELGCVATNSGEIGKYEPFFIGKRPHWGEYDYCG